MKHTGSIVKHGFLILVCVLSLYPIWFLLQTALKTSEQYLLDPVGLPFGATLENFGNLLTDWPVLLWVLNSVIASLSAAAASTAIALLAGYAFVFGRFRGSKLLFNGNLALMAVPPVTLLVPMFMLMVDTRLINQLPSAIIFYVGLFLPFSVFFLTNFLRTVPYELIEAAKVDGLSAFATLRLIVVPLATPALFTLLLVNIIYGWNELLVALVFLQNQDATTLMSGLAQFQGRYAQDQPLVMAGAFFSVMPILLLYIFGQRYFVRGLTAGIGK